MANKTKKPIKSITSPISRDVSDIDVNREIITDVIEAADNSRLDINTLNSFTSISRSRDNLYNLLDTMGDDPIISSALEIYASDVCEPNDEGKIVWAVSDDEKCLGAVNNILKQLDIEKNSYRWVYSLLKYGDLYLRLFRNSEAGTKDERQALNEDVIVKAYSKNDHYSGYIEEVRNPAEVFNLYRFGKSYGYLRTHINHKEVNPNDISINSSNLFNSYQFNRNDVDVYAATELAHASLDDNITREDEMLTIFDGSPDESDPSTRLTYTVRRGQSILYNSFKIWRELNLLEQSVLLNRLTQSSIVRAVSVEVGDMERSQVRSLLQRIKQMFEQKSAINANTSLNEYTNPGPIENTIYVPVHDGKGSMSITTTGGDVKVGDLNDLDYWKKKLFASLGIPGQYLGSTDDNTGFNGGSSLSLISSRYAKNIKRIQVAYATMITDIVNLFLLDSGLYDYVGNFTIRMQVPATQEEKDKREISNSKLDFVRTTMDVLSDIQTPRTRMSILKSLLSDVVSNQEVIALIQEEIDSLTEEENLEDEESYEVDDFNNSPDDYFDDSFEESVDLTTDSDILVEDKNEEEDTLPNFDELGVSYSDAF